MIFHLIIFFLVIINRKNFNFQAALLVILLGATYLSKDLNKLGHKNWTTFAGRNYFDDNGTFIGVVYAGPNLFNSILGLIMCTIEISKMLIKVKTAEFRFKEKQKKKQK
eukprot:TRINITY_DN3257_c0_g1_i2.p1 TRINITY_DN3257_c0_g1~~TRINITY_DN3257_c0_g1_i2.p1  ORF type:complete len:109 (+),score=33.77 TRINITY_DN3257_c0_g1_i2:315-641(+)